MGQDKKVVAIIWWACPAFDSEGANGRSIVNRVRLKGGPQQPPFLIYTVPSRSCSLHAGMLTRRPGGTRMGY